LLRLGTEYGGRVIPADSVGADSICYCVGAGEDLSFDLSLVQQFGATVWTFDPTPRAIAHYDALRKETAKGRRYPINRDAQVTYDVSEEILARLHYVPVGLWKQDETLRFFAPANEEHVSHSIVNLQQTTSYLNVPVRRLKNAMNDLGHDRLDLLKLDIEGAEYAVLDSLLEDKLDVAVICSEYDEWHHPLDAGARKRINDSIGRMKRGGYVLADIDQECNVMFIRKDVFRRLRK
jgi:FkbM family methyltransferase